MLVRRCTYPESDSPDRASTNAGTFRGSSRNSSRLLLAISPSWPRLQGLQLPAQMLTDPGLQKPHDLRGDLQGNLQGNGVDDWVSTPLLGTLLIVYLSQRPFA